MPVSRMPLISRALPVLLVPALVPVLGPPPAGRAATSAVSAAHVPAAVTARVGVSGGVRVPVRADTMSVRIAVRVRAGSAEAVRRAAAQAMARLAGLARRETAAAPDLRAGSLSIAHEDLAPAEGTATGEPAGYRGFQDATLTLRADRPAERVLASILAAEPEIRLLGASFDLADSSAVLRTARLGALRDARRRAMRQAARCGYRLGPVLSVQVQAVGPIPAVLYPREAIAEVGGRLRPPAGTLSVSVYVIYGIG